MPDDVAAQIEKLRQKIARYKAEQSELGLDLSAQIAELERRVRELGGTTTNISNTQVGGITLGEQATLAAADVAGRDKNTAQAGGIVNTGAGAVATGGSVAAGQGGTAIAGNVQGGVNIIGTQIVQQQTSAAETQVLALPEALQRYLDNLINTHRLLRLQGIRAGNQPLSVELEKVYISLTAVEKHAAARAERDDAVIVRGGVLTVGEALARYRRLVIIGDPGSGKTTLLAYLALAYARTLRDGVSLVKERLGLDEAKHLPVFLPLRDLGRHLQAEHPDPGKDGPSLLLHYLHEHYTNQEIPLPEDFFTTALERGEAIILLDGMDEVASVELRQRVARLIEKFTIRYPGQLLSEEELEEKREQAEMLEIAIPIDEYKSRNRFIITSRKVGYDGPARIGAEFGLAEVREFTSAEVRQFVRDWTRAVEATLASGETIDSKRIAEAEAGKLIASIESTPRVAELAVNPLLLTVIALVHRYRAKLPERRSELYEEAVEVLLAGWDEAKGLAAQTTPGGLKLDSGDRRSLLEPVAFWLHEGRQREIELADLRKLLLPSFVSLIGGGERAAAKAVDDFLRLINERSGLLIERGIGQYAFAHLTFQEYLAARALADRADALKYTLKQLTDAWWREVILLEAGYLSTQGKRRASDLIRAIMQADPKTELEPHHHLLLAAECLFDVGGARVEGDLLGEVRQRLKQEADARLTKGDRAQVLRKVAAMNALNRIESGQFTSKFWKPPWGEPEWVAVPAGEFWMGREKGDYDNERPLHRVTVAEFQIARVPTTNAQYALFVAEVKVEPPEHWRGGGPPKGKENHPVVNVSWRDAQAYCRWLGEKIGKVVCLPTEAEWEKASRGGEGQREYPWGDKWEELWCNSSELGLGDTSPVGLFLGGASPYGCLDMAGNVWEWCQSKYRAYPYEAEDGREVIDESNDNRALRGGAFSNSRRFARCAFRYSDRPDGGNVNLPLNRLGHLGFRVVVSRAPA